MAGTVRRAAAMKALWQAFRGARRPGAPAVSTRLRALPRMVAMGLSGRYPYLDKGRLALSLLALVYVVSPVDVVPELVVPLLGFGDDAVVLAFLAGTILSETEAFLAWEADRARTVVGDVVP